MYNANVPKWIYASLCKHFNTVAAGMSIPFYAEGLDDETSEVYQNTNISFRMDGPLSYEGSSLTDHNVDLQLFLTAVGELESGYDVWDYAGTLAEALRGVIPVYQIPESPATQIGCLDLDPRRAVESVRIVNFSRVSTSSNVRQMAAVARLLYESSNV